MLTKYFVKQKKVYLALFIGIVALVVAGCSSNDASTANATPTTAVVTSASASMRHSPLGTLQLSWDHVTHMLTIQVALTGLVPNSSHPAHIHMGSCRNEGKVLYALNNVKADAIGFANTITKVPNVLDGIPANGWYVNVHNGPALQPALQYLPVTCADVTNIGASAKASQAVQATLGTTTAADQAATGNVQLAVANNQLQVTLTMQGLAPRSTHIAHIHEGSCASQGKILYTLKSLVADASGAATSTTVFPNVASIADSGWYVNVHRGPDMTKQYDNDPIACGDITPTH